MEFGPNPASYQLPIQTSGNRCQMKTKAGVRDGLLHKAGGQEVHSTATPKEDTASWICYFDFVKNDLVLGVLERR